MSDAYLCDGCNELKEGFAHRRTIIQRLEEPNSSPERESRDYCEDCWEDREDATDL